MLPCFKRKIINKDQNLYKFTMHSRSLSCSIDQVAMDGQWPDSWFVLAISRSLGIKIRIVFPPVHGNSKLSIDLNDTFGQNGKEYAVMWTATTLPQCILQPSDENCKDWIPNHFVPLLPVSEWDKINDGDGLYAVDIWHVKPNTKFSDILKIIFSEQSFQKQIDNVYEHFSKSKCSEDRKSIKILDD